MESKIIKITEFAFRRSKPKNGCRTTSFTIHDQSIYDAIEDEAKRNGTTITSVIANMLSFLYSQMDSPQLSMDDFATSKPTPKFLGGSESETIDRWYTWARTLTPKELEDFSNQLDLIIRVRGVLLDERRYR